MKEKAVIQHQSLYDRIQSEAAAISALGLSDQVAGHAALHDTSAQGAHQAPDSMLRSPEPRAQVASESATPLPGNFTNWSLASRQGRLVG